RGPRSPARAGAFPRGRAPRAIRARSACPLLGRARTLIQSRAMRTTVAQIRGFLALLAVGCGMPEPAAEPASEGAADVEAAEHARYAFRATARGLEARSAEHGFALVARARGLTITQQERELSLRTTRIGRPGRLEALA